MNKNDILIQLDKLAGKIIELDLLRHFTSEKLEDCKRLSAQYDDLMMQLEGYAI